MPNNPSSQPTQPLTDAEPRSRFAFDAGAHAALLGLAPGETFRFDSGFVAERLPDEGFTMSFDSNGELTLVALLNADLTMRISAMRELKPRSALGLDQDGKGNG